jgi:hypothetical protein
VAGALTCRPPVTSGPWRYSAGMATRWTLGCDADDPGTREDNEFCVA